MIPFWIENLMYVAGGVFLGVGFTLFVVDLTETMKKWNRNG